MTDYTADTDRPSSPPLRRLITLFDALGQIRSDLSISTVAAFLMVARDPGRTQADYSRSTGINPQTLSRLLLDLGDVGRAGQPGFGLVAQTTTLQDRRIRLYTLTAKGQRLLNTLLEIVR